MLDTIFTVVGLVGAAIIGAGVIVVAARARLQQTPQCFFCARPTDEDAWCFGCEHYVCLDCDKNEPWGEHDIDEHPCCDDADCDFCFPTDPVENND